MSVNVDLPVSISMYTDVSMYLLITRVDLGTRGVMVGHAIPP